MIDDRDLFERAIRRFPPPERSFDRLLTRRSRKQRNRRLGAGVVSLVIVLVAVLVGTSIIRSDRRRPAGPTPAFNHNGAVAIVDRNGSVSLIGPGATASRSELSVCPGCELADLAWSPDGTKIAFTTTLAGSVRVFDVATNETSTIATCEEPHENCSWWHIDWSPDGSRIALGDSGRLDLLDPNGQHRITLADFGEQTVGRPTWSPDGSSIAFPVDDGSAADLYRIDADGSHLQKMLDLGGSGSNGADGPDWSPDGSRIAFTVFTSDPSSEGRMFVPAVWIVDAQGSRPSKLFEGGPCCLGRSTGLAWSPDGTTLAFVSTPAGSAAFDPTASLNLYLIDPDGGDLQVLAADVPLGQPAWQPVP